MSNATDATSGYDYHDSLIIAHAVFASLATFILVPGALLTARYFRGSSFWFKVHFTLNGLALCFLIMVFGMGARAVSYPDHGNQFTGAKSDTHHRFGLATFILMCLQALLGLTTHYTKTGKGQALFASGKSPLRYLHPFCGIVMAGVLYATIYSGFHEWTIASDNGTMTPVAVRIVFWIVFAIEVILYGVGFYLERGRTHASNTVAGKQQDMGEKEPGIGL